VATTVNESAGLLLERELELDELAAAIASAATGAGRLVAVEGTAGIGKTRLLAEARTAASRDGLRVLAARGGEFEAEFAYGIVRQLFEPLIAGASPELRTALFAGPAALVEPLFDPEALRGDPIADSTFAVQHGLYWLAANAAYERPTLLAVDDLHWADSASLRWLTYLARRLDGLPLLVLVATRPPDQGHDPALLVELLGDPAAELLEPRPLGVASIERLARDSFGLDPDEPFCAAVAVATGGNPLFAVAVLDTVVREHVHPRAESAREVLAVGPRAISRAVSVRLAALSGDALALVRAAAILGDGAALRHAAALAGTDIDPASRDAGTLVRLDLLRRPDPLEFFHPVVRAAVHAEIDPGERIVLHRRAAEILAAEGAPVEQVAGHLVQVAPAGDPGIVATLREGARSAQASGANDAALAYLRRAWAEPPGDAERFATLFELGLAERRLARPEAVETLAAALDEATGEQDRVAALVEYSRVLFHANRPEEAVELLRGAVDEVDIADPDLREQLDADLIVSAMWLADYYPVAQERLRRINIDRLHGGWAAPSSSRRSPSTRPPAAGRASGRSSSPTARSGCRASHRKEPSGSTTR
jgi:tetratricopeptide (TPR) repeat protein